MKSIKHIIYNLRYLTSKQIFAIIILIISLIFLFNLFRFNSSGDTKDAVVSDNIKHAKDFDYSTVEFVEAKLEREGDNVQITSDESNKAKYKTMMKKSVVIGDSITEGLKFYGFLSEDQVFCKIGASLIKSENDFKKAASLYPKAAFFSFGMNDMGNYKGDEKAFITKYKKLLKQFHKTSPKTKLYINSISIPNAEAQKNNTSLKNYKKFNKALRSMCKDMNITYIDNGYILEENPHLYASDGIHVNPGYYYMWLENMILKAGLQ